MAFPKSSDDTNDRSRLEFCWTSENQTQRHVCNINTYYQFRSEISVCDMESVTNATFDYNSTFRKLDFGSNELGNGNGESTILGVIFLALLVVGIFANVLVVSVQASRLTTSTRVYTFSLASADAVVCIGSVGAVFVKRWIIIQRLFAFVISLAVIFSLFFLAFVATERCVAVLRPHTFKLNIRRAIIAVTLMMIGSTICAAAIIVAKVLPLDTVLLSMRIAILTSTCAIITCSYFMVAVTLCKRSRDKANRRRPTKGERKCRSSTRVAPEIQLSTVSSQLNRSSCVEEFIKSPHCVSLVSTGYLSAPGVNELVKSKGIARSKTPGTLLLVFVITAVYFICWLPFWLRSSGVPISAEFDRLVILHPVLNPLVYAFLSPMFRDDVRQSFRQTRIKLTRCCDGRSRIVSMFE